MSSTWLRRLLTIALLALGVVLALAGPAAADDGGGDRNGFAWIDIEDSNGVPIWKYSLDFDEGGWTSPGKSFWASMIGFAWGMYKIAVLIPLWLLDWVLQMGWIQMLAAPALLLGDAMQTLVDQFGVTRVFLMAAVMVAGLLVFRGRVATGIYEVCMSMTMAALALGLLAQPVQLIAGPGGWLEQTHRAGLEISVALTGGSTSEATSADELREQQMAMLSDVFVSKPYQVVNFGRVLTPECEEKYTEAMREKEFAQAPEARDAIKDCDEGAAEYANNVGAEMMFPVWVFLPGAAAIMVLVLMVAGAVLTAGANAIFQSIKLVLTLLTGLLPGRARGPVWATIAHTLVSLAMVVGSSAFLGGFIVMVTAVFDQGREDRLNPIAVFAMVDVVLVVGTVVFWRWRRQVLRSAGRLAEAMSTRPGGGGQATAREPRSITPYALKAAHLASSLATHRALRRAGDADEPTPAAASVKKKPIRRAALETSTRRALAAGPLKGREDDGGTSTPTSAGPTPQGPSSPTSSRRAVGVAAAGAQLGAAALTGGTSAAVSVAAKKAGVATASSAAQRSSAGSDSAARRAAVMGKLGATAAAGPVGVHRPSPMPHEAQRFDRVVKNGRVVLVPSDRATS